MKDHSTVFPKEAHVKQSGTHKKIWIDLDNSPHVPFFIPIMQELEARGHSVYVTTRDCFQVCSLADYHHLEHHRIGRHYGANKLLKVLGTIWRSLQLLPHVLRERPALSLSHGSRSLIIASWLLNIPTVLLFDYEFARMLPVIRPELGIAPDAVTDPGLARHFKQGLRSYRGLKEDVYVASFRPDPLFRTGLGLSEQDIVVAIRPPANEAHYHNPESEPLFRAVVDRLGSCANVRMVILPRNEKAQRELILRTWPDWCADGRILLPDRALNGLDLIWHSDLVVSGGGTMNREAAALGVPVYSIFRGRIGAVDRYLAQQGRLTLLESAEDVETKIRIERRNKPQNVSFGGRTALQQIVNAIEEVAAVPIAEIQRKAPLRERTHP